MFRKVASLLLVLAMVTLVFAPPALSQTSGASGSGNSGAAAGAVIAIVAIVCGGIIVLLALALLVLWILMLIDAVNRDESQYPNPSGNTKTVWVVVLAVSFVFGFYWLAAILYYFLVRRPHPLPKA